MFIDNVQPSPIVVVWEGNLEMEDDNHWVTGIKPAWPLGNQKPNLLYQKSDLSVFYSICTILDMKLTDCDWYYECIELERHWLCSQRKNTVWKTSFLQNYRSHHFTCTYLDLRLLPTIYRHIIAFLLFTQLSDSFLYLSYYFIVSLIHVSVASNTFMGVFEKLNYISFSARSVTCTSAAG